jgi:PAS domain S-box-containing protein
MSKKAPPGIKLLGGIGLAGLGAIAAVVMIAQGLTERVMHTRAQSDLRAARQAADAFFGFRLQALSAEAATTAELPRVRAAVITPGLDEQTLREIAQSIQRIHGSDRVGLFDRRGKLLVNLAQTAQPGDDPSLDATVREALSGRAFSGIVNAQTGHHLLASCPVRTMGLVDGVVVLAEPITSDLLAPLEAVIRCRVSFHPESAEILLSPIQEDPSWRASVHALVAWTGILFLVLALAASVLYARRLLREYVSHHLDQVENKFAPLLPLERLLEVIPDAVLLLSAEGAIESANTAAAHLLGMGASDLAGRRAASFFDETQEKRFTDLCASQRAHGVELTCIGKSRNRIPVGVSTVLWRKAKDSGDAVICILQDRSDRKQAAELKRAYERLEQQRTTQPLESGRERPQEFETLLGGLVHEVKNSLAILIQGVDFLRASSPSDKESGVLRMMADAIRRVDQTVVGTLHSSTPPAVDLKPLHMSAVIDQALEQVRELMEASRIELSRQIDPDMPLTLIDAHHMASAVAELLQNAIHAMPNGGKLSIDCRAQRLAAPEPGVGSRAADRFTQGQTACVCQISDTGVGITSEQRRNLFRPFAGAKSSGRKAGLGLSIVRNVIEAHGGLIRLESASGQGTRVRILLPLAPRTSKARRVRILLIDDDISLCKMMKLNLERFGEFEVTTVFLGQSGVEQAMAHDFNLVITDFQMPDINGDVVIRRIKAEKPSLPVLLFSIYHDLNVPITPEARRMADGLLKKPIDHRDLYQAIEQALSRKSARENAEGGS